MGIAHVPAEGWTLRIEDAVEKLMPKSQIVSEAWVPLGATEFTSHITKTGAARPDLVVTSMWGGMYIAFYKQALPHGLFSKTRLAGNINFGVVPHAIGKDHPEGALAGVHSNYHFTYPAPARSPLNKQFVERYQQRWKEYPNYTAEAAYTGLHLFKAAVEKANKEADGWPSDEAISRALEGTIAAPSGTVRCGRRTTARSRTSRSGSARTSPTTPSRSGILSASSPCRCRR